MRSLNTVYARLRITAGQLAVLVFVLSLGNIAQAEWQDPLNTPAMKTLKAPYSMLLDVVEAGNRLVAVGDRGHVIYSDDDGRSWTQANVPVTTALTSVFFSDNQHGWVWYLSKRKSRKKKLKQN